MTSQTSSEWGGDSAWPVAFLHGDFNTTNLLVDSQTGQLQIIDWSVTDMCDEKIGTAGPCYFDVSWFIFGLCKRRFWGLERIYRIDNKVDAFLCGYFQESRNSCNMAEFKDYLQNVFYPAVFSLPLNKPKWERMLKGRHLLMSYPAFSRIVQSLIRQTPVE